MTTRENLSWKLPNMPRLFGTQLYLAHEAGADIQEMAEMLEAPVEWVRERIEAARLCLEKQVEVVGPHAVDGLARTSGAIYLFQPDRRSSHVQ